jgi:hypothetical protein
VSKKETGSNKYITGSASLGIQDSLHAGLNLSNFICHCSGMVISQLCYNNNKPQNLSHLQQQKL